LVRADTPLSIPALYNCLLDFGGESAIVNPPTVTTNFTLPLSTGLGVFTSEIPVLWDEHIPPGNKDDKLYTYSYTIDLSGIASSTSHCVRLRIHFGGPAGCAGPGLQGNPSEIQSATLATWGDVNIVFNTGCLSPGQSPISFSMVSESGFKTNVVTIIDDYVNPSNGHTNEIAINVPAIVPDVPPNPPPWVIAYYSSRFNSVLSSVLLQGDLDIVGTNQTSTNFPPIHANGPYDIRMQVAAYGTNGPFFGPLTTQAVSVVNGIFTVPLPGDPVAFGDGSVRFVNMSVRPTGSSSPFTLLSQPLQVAPTPQAFYAFSAGSVADLAPGQAVISLNGLTDAVMLQAGNGIALNTSGNSITISAPGAASDRNIKTGITPISTEDILTRLAALPISSWRYTNEMADVRHVGPMAQDFKDAFGLGSSDKIIGFVDEEGVALAAIQGLNQKLDQKDATIQTQAAEIADLKARLEKVERQLDAH
jgi:hypothetical protein